MFFVSTCKSYVNTVMVCCSKAEKDVCTTSYRAAAVWVSGGSGHHTCPSTMVEVLRMLWCQCQTVQQALCTCKRSVGVTSQIE